MRRILLAVLNLSGWLIFCTCLLYEYHYVSDQKNWTEAQNHCRQDYTDLATIENTTELNQFINVSSVYSIIFWTGLYSKFNWTWSDGYMESEADNRHTVSLKSYLGRHWCMSISQFTYLHFDNCSAEYPFICYNGTQQDPEFTCVNESRNWFSAQSYCRENFTDLATVKNSIQKLKTQNLVPGGNRAWIGLNGYYDLYWSDGSSVESFFWDRFHSIDLNIPMACGLLNRLSNEFILYPCYTTHPFMCDSRSPPSPAGECYCFPVEQRACEMKMLIGFVNVYLKNS
uniref:C-type lectin domain-containing protein n=1 Tax=Anabas testudineus TaxID=64144 RepID=A0AAQ6IMC2_ANATE